MSKQRHKFHSKRLAYTVRLINAQETTVKSHDKLLSLSQFLLIEQFNGACLYKWKEICAEAFIVGHLNSLSMNTLMWSTWDHFSIYIHMEMPDWDAPSLSQRGIRGDCRREGNGDPPGVRFTGEGMCLIGDLRIWLEIACCCVRECLAASFETWSCSRDAKTSDIRGRSLASKHMHCKAMVATE